MATNKFRSVQSGSGEQVRPPTRTEPGGPGCGAWAEETAAAAAAPRQTEVVRVRSAIRHRGWSTRTARRVSDDATAADDVHVR